MINFIKWACNESPVWVQVPFFIAAGCIVFTFTAFVATLFFKGYFLAASAITIVAPLAFTYYQYRKHTNAQ